MIASAMPKSPLSRLVDLHDLTAVWEEVSRLDLLMCPGMDLAPISAAYQDMRRLFAGRYPGYRACNTRFHDIHHTTDALVAMTRLMHGAFVSGARFSEPEIVLAEISAVFHDSGYIQTSEDTKGTGAQYTACHVDRSIIFLDRYFLERSFPPQWPGISAELLRCTGLNVDIEGIEFAPGNFNLLGRMLGAGDLLGQMADRTYLKKLLYLYEEFQEGHIPGFASELELLQKTVRFYEATRTRLAHDLGGVDRHMRAHFKARWGIDRDLYAETIRGHIDYLKAVLAEHPEDYRRFLRREAPAA